MADRHYESLRVDPTEAERIEEALDAGPRCIVRTICADGPAIDCQCFVEALRAVRANPTAPERDRRRFIRGRPAR